VAPLRGAAQGVRAAAVAARVVRAKPPRRVHREGGGGVAALVPTRR
jgi:hypothetical protein